MHFPQFSSNSRVITLTNELGSRSIPKLTAVAVLLFSGRIFDL